ncbi:hypothetical protein CVT26_007744 [Gymnopilus dilepis]|uniref:Uncharacterized protein n=1 Tax=Gymnopilus dilepis TaxID=231916 RepID=A0A409X654_9AGAR|nr:hypothetical protein CVT26_007744 [Gymnopilus dilepis]
MHCQPTGVHDYRGRQRQRQAVEERRRRRRDEKGEGWWRYIGNRRGTHGVGGPTGADKGVRAVTACMPLFFLFLFISHILLTNFVSFSLDLTIPLPWCRLYPPRREIARWGWIFPFLSTTPPPISLA